MIEHTVTVEATIRGAEVSADALVAVLEQLERHPILVGPALSASGNEISMTATVLARSAATSRLHFEQDAAGYAVDALGHALMTAGLADIWRFATAPDKPVEAVMSVLETTTA